MGRVVIEENHVGATRRKRFHRRRAVAGRFRDVAAEPYEAREPARLSS